MLDATGPRRYKTSTLHKTSTLVNLDTASTLQNLVLILLLNFNTLPIYRKRSKRFAKIPKGAPTYSMVLKQSVLGGSNASAAAEHTPAATNKVPETVKKCIGMTTCGWNKSRHAGHAKHYSGQRCCCRARWAVHLTNSIA